MDISSGNRVASEQGGSAPQDYQIQVPTINLPKGGGAVRGIGEKFAANPVTGTGSMSVPIASSPGRSSFGPQLSLNYDSGAGNGPFGLGWNLALPHITRRTDRGIPRYNDHDPYESDIFLLSGSEDLVLHDEQPPPFTVNGTTYQIRRYRPRIEGLFALIERWTNQTNPAETFWRSISKDNVTTWYGKTQESRICNPAAPSQIFTWLMCETHDDKGNVIVYCYKEENSEGVDFGQAHELNRSEQSIAAERYLRAIRYGNRAPYLPDIGLQGPLSRPPKARLEDDASNDWMFELVFDYGASEGPPSAPAATGNWQRRFDSFSSYRSGFEVRTYRRCHRALMFHHFPDVEAIGANCLVRATRFIYGAEGDLTNPLQPGYSVLDSVEQHSYERNPASASGYESRQLPPVHFKYSQPSINEEVREVAPEYLENLPVGLQGSGYQWIDLDGEGLSGVLTEQGNAWYYKPNLGDGRFGALKQVAARPAMAALNTGRQQLMDLAGDGELDLVDFQGPTPGFHERTIDENWKGFIPFASLPVIDWSDPNLRFLDLTGDGFADALITEQDVFTWYPSLAEEGFGPAERVRQPFDEEAGPHLVFADSTQTVFLADMCGDGLTDLVRIRNGQTCYWPNLGYGKFGAKVTLDGSPRFDHADLFDTRRIRLSDIDGSGPVDLIYLGRDGAQLYFNRSGNSLSNARVIEFPLATENLGAVQVADLLGNGTACLVWSSHLPADARHPVRYIDLMGSTRQATQQDDPKKHAKPHLLIRVDNNLGATTEIEYTPSTYFYLQDKQNGTPWITRLGFPVHCVSKVTARDQWRGTAFRSTYSYHHGYFDGIEREFRGFGRVEQVDVEDYGTFADGNTASPYITADKTLYQPPVKTITWYHTGAALERTRILTQFDQEYFPRRYAERLNDPANLHPFHEKPLPEPELPAALSADEWREALRACKGMVLRQEIYELDVDDLAAEKLKQTPVRIFSAATHNCHIQCLQRKGDNPHAVFLVTESEAISYHYELALPKGDSKLKPDPRIAHTLNLRHDEQGNAQQSIAIGYGRWQPGSYSDLPRPDLITQVQSERHIAYSEIRYTGDCILRANPLDSASPVKHHRLRLPCEVRTYELTGLRTLGTPPAFYFDIGHLRRHQLCEDNTYPPIVQAGTTVSTLGRLEYHQQPPSDQQPPDGNRYRRVVEQARSLYFDDSDGVTQPTQPLPFGQSGPRGLKYEDYKLALTAQLLNAIFQQRDPATGNLIDDKLAWEIEAGSSVRQRFDEPVTPGSPYLKTGYIQGSALDSSFAGQYWMRTGIAGFATDANRHFYLPEEYTDPFGNVTTLRFDPLDLFMASSSDALGNTTQVSGFNPQSTTKTLSGFDYRVLAPHEMVDANGNHTEVVFDILGLPVAAAIKGKQAASGTWQGDDLTGFDFALRNPSAQAVQQFCTDTVMNESTARNWLGNATTRFVYHFGDFNGEWNRLMAGACSIAREQHKSPTSKLQVSLECSDGGGNVLMKKVQAEPDPATPSQPRWIINGLTVLNNKGKPVKQYEPAFTDRFGCQMPQAEGVTPILYYDAPGRLIRTEMPDGTFSRVEFSPWHVKTFDANDTVLESQWYQDRGAPDPAIALPSSAPPDTRAAWLAAHHADTPAQTLLDSQGREVISIAHNRTPDAPGTWQDDFYLTYTKLDAEGKPLWIRDARGNLVMQYINPPKPTRLADTLPNPLDSNDSRGEYIPAGSAPCYDIAGNLLFQHSMDAGDRWMITDAAGKPMFAWDIYEASDTSPGEERLYSTQYDALHRPTALWLKVDNKASVMVESYEYRDTQLSDGSPNPQLVQDQTANLIGQLLKHHDPSGLLETVRLDFKGNVQEVHRTLNNQPTATRIDWQTNPAASLGNEIFVQITEHDALNRMSKQFNWHRGDGSRVAVYLPQYGERGVLKSEKLIVGAIKTKSPDGYRGGQENNAILDIRYDPKGQRQFLKLGNGTVTQYDYDPDTFRLRQLRSTRPGYLPAFPDYRSNLNDPKVLQQLHYTFDPVGNIAEIHDEAYKTTFFQNAIVEPKSLYEYDALYRLIKATGREDGAITGAPDHFEAKIAEGSFPITSPNALRRYTQTFRYDAVGNILRMHHDAGMGTWNRDYDYAPDSNRLSKTTQGGQTTDYHYDSHGSMLNLANVAPGQYWQWDHRDMIAAINLGNGFAHYQYDAGKQRTRKWIDRSEQLTPGNTQNIQEERIYLGGLELYRRWVNDVLKEEIETLHLFDGEQRLLMVDQILETDNTSLGKRTLYRYTLSNHLGSSTVELDDKAGIISYEEYHPYGTSAYRAGRNAAEVKLKRYRYTGMERDEESGLSYHSARYYLPWLGRWGGCDPAGIGSGINFYLYGGANPSGTRDRNGLQDEPLQKNSAYYERMADWFDNQGWIEESKEYRALQHKAAYEEGMAEFREIRDKNAKMSWGVIGIASAIAVAPVVGMALFEVGAPAVSLFVFKHQVMIYFGSSFTIGLLDPNPVGSIDIPGPIDDAGRAARSGLRQIGGAADETAKAVEVSSDRAAELLKQAPAMIEKALQRLKDLVPGLDTTLMKVSAASPSELAEFARKMEKNPADFAAFYEVGTRTFFQLEHLFKGEEEVAAVKVTLSTLEQASKNGDYLASKLGHEAVELNWLHKKLTEVRGLSAKTLALLIEKYHMNAVEFEESFRKLAAKNP